ncbi:hypothetical protein RF11_05985 [Thelohanellus kitauei]|uniref:Uncharacterized protein n=1 Tax=Thelohanellus kitauei TaxID=669202 RepID=A0A0C2J786_THEKT|nr:hypothetical protein RF11_05985 [Thelohanellus kitauei]
MGGQARTNNAVEGWHNSLSKSLRSSHPNIWVFSKAIQNEQNLKEFKLAHANEDANTHQRRRYRDLIIRIENLVRLYQLGTNVLNFVVRVACNLNIVVIYKCKTKTCCFIDKNLCIYGIRISSKVYEYTEN